MEGSIMEEELIDIVKILEEKVEKCNWWGNFAGYSINIEEYTIIVSDHNGITTIVLIKKLKELFRHSSNTLYSNLYKKIKNKVEVPKEKMLDELITILKTL